MQGVVNSKKKLDCEKRACVKNRKTQNDEHGISSRL
jgi:hypothetical protein